MNFENPLSNLKDIHIPPSISYWPPAPGWWFLGVFFLLILIFSFIWIFKKYQRLKPKKEAIIILNNIRYEYKKNNNKSAALTELSKLIRRVALTFFPREEVASLQGIEWLRFLDKSGETSSFSDGIGTIFGEEIYMKNPKANMIPLFSIVNEWINIVIKNKK